MHLLEYHYHNVHLRNSFQFADRYLIWSTMHSIDFTREHGTNEVFFNILKHHFIKPQSYFDLGNLIVNILTNAVFVISSE